MKASVPVSRPQIRTFAQATDLDRALCQFVSESLGQAIELRGKSTLVVSGGSTPLGFLRLLAQQRAPPTGGQRALRLAASSAAYWRQDSRFLSNLAFDDSQRKLVCY